MKKLLVFMPLLIAAVSCKKDLPPVVAPTLPVKQLSVKVNGSAEGCSTCYGGSSSGGTQEANFAISSNEAVRLFFEGIPPAGTYSLSSSNYSVSMIYERINGLSYTYYHAVSGSIAITSIDTSSHGVVNKLAATFNFQTDTIGGQAYAVTDGTINLKP